MRNKLYALLTAVCLPAFAEPLVFTPLPMEAPKTVAAQWIPVLRHLGVALGAEPRIEYAESYAAVLEKFRAGQIDLAYLGPLPYVTLKTAYPAAEPVVHFKEKNGEATYTCAIVALTERQLAARQIRGLTVALTQPLSTCGYLATAGLLQRAGSDLEKNRYRYLGTHETVALAVARGNYDAGGLKTAIGRKYAHLGLTTLAETPPLPAFTLVANGARLSAEQIGRIRRALLDADAATRANWGDNVRHGTVAAADADFDPVRALIGKRRIPEQGNF